MGFLLDVPKSQGKGNDNRVELVKKAVEKANADAQTGVVTSVNQDDNRASILINSMRLRCGTDMCISNDLAALLNTGDACGSLTSNECQATPNCTTPSGSTVCADACTYNADGTKKTDKDDCSGKCLRFTVTKGGATTTECRTDFKQTAERACFAGCTFEGTSPDYNCVALRSKAPDKSCRPVKEGDETTLCKRWYNENAVTTDMAGALVNNYNCSGTTCPVVPAPSDATAQCQKNICVDDKESGYETKINPIFDGDKVVPCPVLKDKRQSFAFPMKPDDYPFDQTTCDTACGASKCTYVPRLMITGKGDAPQCVVSNVSQTNNLEAAKKAISNSLQSVDLQTIRNALSEVARTAAQTGFNFSEKDTLQNLSRSVVSSARNIRQRAAQDCGGGAFMNNYAEKICRNYAKNGRAMPCIMSGGVQSNVAKAAGDCLQQVVVNTKALDKIVKEATAKGQTLPVQVPFSVFWGNNDDVRQWTKSVNAMAIIVLAVVVAAVIVACILRFDKKRIGRSLLDTLRWVGLGGLVYAALPGIIGSMLTSKSRDPVVNFKTFLKVKDGFTTLTKKGSTMTDTLNGAAEACRKDPKCKAWVFQSKTTTPAGCDLSQPCTAKRCTAEGDCDKCCPQGCIAMVTDGKNMDPATNDCASKTTKEACVPPKYTGPCLYVGDEDGKCVYSPGAYGKVAPIKTPDRLWCMECSDKEGTVYLMNELDRDDGTYFDKDKNPIRTKMTNSELACFNTVKNTMGIKETIEDPWRNQGNALRTSAIILAVSSGCVALISTLVLAFKK